MVKLSDSAQGVLYATAAYVWWGFLPLFWAIFDPVGNGWEVIAHRIFCGKRVVFPDLLNRAK